jgi:quinoprotein glucose dehydrogenase
MVYYIHFSSLRLAGGAWLATIGAVADSSRRNHMQQQERRWWMATLALVLCELALTAPAAAQDGWSHYAGDTYQRYSSLGMIDAGNVGDLRVAWRRPGLAPEVAAVMPERRPGAYHKSTPILVGGVLYASDAVGLVEAFDPGTGETLWVQPLPADDASRGQSVRGVEFWSDGQDRRIISIRDEYLYALDANTGRPIPSFGTEGRVLLTRPEPGALGFGGAQAPLVIGDVIVVAGLRGGAGDRSRVKEREPEDIYGYDVRTGRELWVFNVVPRPGEVGAETWENDAWEYAGDLGAWCCLSADPELGLVYAPLTANSGSMWGGWRPGHNLFTNTLVAIDAESGRLAWHYQVIHHGIWEYDNIGVPLLADLTVDGETVPAVMLTNKNGFLYVLNRETGEPVRPILERPVPQEPKVLGEILSPTQPIPTWPVHFDRQGISEDDLIDFTPELRADALEFVEDYVLGPLYAPTTLVGDEPGEKLGTIAVPGSWGSANWHSTAFDPELQLTFVASHTLPGIAGVAPPSPEDIAEGATMEYVRVAPSPIFGPHDLPLTKPPYGRMTAIDMRTGQQAWMKANGDGPRNHPLLRDLVLPPLGYSSRPVPLVTGTLLFLGEGSDAFGGTSGEYQWGTKFRAYDKRTGSIVWETDLRIGTTGGPMTYMHEGKQFIVIPAGDREQGPEWIAFTLP